MNLLSSVSPPKPVALLGYGGLLPFLGLALLAVVAHGQRLLWCQALVSYGAVILSFVGALHWGFAMIAPGMNAQQRHTRFIWSIVPALMGWVATLLPLSWGGLLLIVGFFAHWWQDRQLSQVMHLPAWYLPMRLRLTIVASACLLLGVLVMAIGS
ncbi:MAG: DUF3429 domain-containing protein [Pseudomonas protegens]|uniref:DUF3429 domain-containing protein n=1 Tax=Pseudomonas sp. LD120 TaxID=485751 RepID=UPI00135BE0ED|nr:DUF3429 domain-containing protein [Pseudomonas sp. LD120]KAF0864405.1 DUF3429 family protein [Pseudomonas sp. LD120]